jgi:arylsulfatase A-like enzyme
MHSDTLQRRDFLRAAAGFAAPALFGAPARQPNVVLILADDLGYADLGVQGSKDIRTPQVDSIARNGVRFNNGYVSCPVCSPTRAGLMTGRYQQRFGHELNPGPADQAAENFGLPLSETTVANRMKALGYTTGITGKWHLGYRPEFHPLKRGFDEFFGFLGGAHSYVDALADKSNLILRGVEPVNEQAYLTEALGREAVAFIERHRRERFFLYLPFNAVHNPPQATEKYLARFASIQDETRRILAAKLAAMDDAVGGVLAKLRETGLEDNTLIFFISDNGGPTPTNGSRNDPLRGYKGQALEGGIRVPFLMQWKGRVPAGKVYDAPVMALDVHPTVVAAAGGSIPAEAKLDGVNLLPFVTGKAAGVPHERLFWRFGAERAIRMGDWKLLWQGDGSAELYNLARDIGEKNNVAAAEPARVKQLEAAYAAWNAQLAEPKWGGRQRARRRRKR